MNKMKKVSINTSSLQVYDWVLIDGEPKQITRCGGQIFVEDETGVRTAQIAPAPITLHDLDVIIEKLKKIKLYNLTYREYTPNGMIIIDLSFQTLNQPMYYISKPILYYHELQHALREVTCPLKVNYWWSHEIEEEVSNVE